MMASGLVTPNGGPLSTSFSDSLAPRFVFVTSQVGAEKYLKKQLMTPETPFRLAFSRPGLLTFKFDAPETPAAEDVPQPPAVKLPDPPTGILIRQSGYGLGQVRGEDGQQLVQELIDLAGKDWDAVHVFERDPALPGTRAFEPGASPLTDSVRELLGKQMPGVLATGSNGIAPTGARVLDVILVDTNHWLIGFHRAEQLYQRWPGGAFPLSSPPEMVSRAYRKAAEAVAWSELPIEPEDRLVEIGSAPGGASQRFLDLGLQVTGVDPAEMDPLLLEHQRFEHWRSKSNAVKRKRFASFRWLAADANVAPNYTLDAVEDLVTYPSSQFEGLLLTFKLTDYALVEQFPEYLMRIRGWGFKRVRARQLASNRQECCVVARR